MRSPAPVEEYDLTALLARFELPLLQSATRILGDRERARDVVQETFLELQRHVRRQTDAAPAKWLFTVCRNRALNICRKEKRMTYLDDEILDREAGAGPAPNERIEREEASGFLLRIVATLPPQQQEVVQLKFQNDLSYQEISEITHLSVSHVGVLLHTALKTLRARCRLAKLVEEKPEGRFVFASIWSKTAGRAMLKKYDGRGPTERQHCG